MKKISIILTIYVLLLTFSACDKPCNENLRIGEIVQIPILFSDFSLSEINNTIVYRIDKSGTNTIDTFLMREILWANSARTTNEIITDKKPENVVGSYNEYDSYFNKCDLIFEWNTGKDTLFNFEIIKSQENKTGCNQNDPNVKIDKLSFVYKGKIIAKNEKIKIDN
jgi:hypothetical protein